MRKYWIIWHYRANYSDDVVEVSAYSPEEAAEQIYSGRSDDFRQVAEVFVFDYLPTSVFRGGEKVWPDGMTDSEATCWGDAQS